MTSGPASAPGNRAPLVAAEYLITRGHPVSFKTRMASAGADLAETRDLSSMYARLRRQGVEFTTNAEIVAVNEDVVTLRDVHTDEHTALEDVDWVVLSTGNRATDGLQHELESAGSTRVLAADDRLAPRRIFNTIWEGELAGRAA